MEKLSVTALAAFILLFAANAHADWNCTSPQLGVIEFHDSFQTGCSIHLSTIENARYVTTKKSPTSRKYSCEEHLSEDGTVEYSAELALVEPQGAAPNLKLYLKPRLNQGEAVVGLVNGKMQRSFRDLTCNFGPSNE